MPNLRMLSLLVPCLIGCTALRPTDGAPETSRIVERYWGLRQFDGRTIHRRELEVATIRFLPNRQFSGTASCNRVGGARLTWSIDAVGNGGRFSHDNAQPMIQTLAGCADHRAGDIANSFWQRMDEAVLWSLRGERLRISFSDGSAAELVPVNVPLVERRPVCGPQVSNNFDCK